MDSLESLYSFRQYASAVAIFQKTREAGENHDLAPCTEAPATERNRVCESICPSRASSEFQMKEAMREAFRGQCPLLLAPGLSAFLVLFYSLITLWQQRLPQFFQKHIVLCRRRLDRLLDLHQLSIRPLKVDLLLAHRRADVAGDV